MIKPYRPPAPFYFSATLKGPRSVTECPKVKLLENCLPKLGQMIIPYVGDVRKRDLLGSLRRAALYIREASMYDLHTKQWCVEVIDEASRA
jgi:hypothetical protein